MKQPKGREAQIIAERKRKIAELRKAGVNPYPYKYDKNTSSKELQKKYEKLKAEEKTKEQIKLALVDWKGCGKSEERQSLIKLLEKLNLKYKRTSEIDK